MTRMGPAMTEFLPAMPLRESILPRCDLGHPQGARPLSDDPDHQLSPLPPAPADVEAARTAARSRSCLG